jgi:hypothetical protein
MEALPDFIVMAEQRLPGIRNLTNLAGQIQLAAGNGDESSDQILHTVAALLDNLQAEVKLLRARVEMQRGNPDWATVVLDESEP